ncbi:hypothetical protein HUU05_20945 [candidate division KSB1 bacterium]|nr:hypothetical protein [candidate division KSB1 bacterium]
MPRVSRSLPLFSLRMRLSRFAKFVRRSLRATAKRRSASFLNGPTPRARRYGCYHLQGNRFHSGGLIIAPSRAALANVFLDVLGEMGGQVVVVMGENYGMPRPLLSISPPVTANWLQALLANYADVLNKNHGVELSVQSVEKCCSLVLTPDKHIFMHVCDPTRYIRALESRGLREVEHMPVASPRRKLQHASASSAEEVRLDELKQYLSVNSSTFSPQQEWLH